MNLLRNITLLCCSLSTVLFADFKKDVSLLGADEYETREQAHSRLDSWLLKNPSGAKKKLFAALKNTKDPEASSRLYELLRKSVIVEKFGSNPGFLGISMISTSIQLEGGEKIYAVLVREVVPHSAAEKAGILAGDKIIQIDGRPFTKGDTPVDAADQQLMGVIQSKAPIEKITLRILSKGFEKDLTISLGEMPKRVRKKWERQKFPGEIRDIDEFFEDWLLENADW